MLLHLVLHLEMEHLKQEFDFAFFHAVVHGKLADHFRVVSDEAWLQLLKFSRTVRLVKHLFQSVADSVDHLLHVVICHLIKSLYDALCIFARLEDLPQGMPFMHERVLFDLLHSVDLFETLLEHPEILGVQDVNLNLVEDLKHSVTLKVDL